MREEMPVKISTKGRYGLRLMVDLAVHYQQGLVPLKEIAVRQDLSEKYLEQIMMQLNRSGLVRSVRGAQGGYTLAMDPASITVGAVLRVMEGSLTPVDCVSGDSPGCARMDQCVTAEVWRRLDAAIAGVVDSITLADLREEYERKNPPDYCI